MLPDGLVEPLHQERAALTAASVLKTTRWLICTKRRRSVLMTCA